MWVPMVRERFQLFRRRCRVIFIHVPKCAGSYVEAAFQPWIRLCPTRTWRRTRGHLTWREYSRAFAGTRVRLEDHYAFSAVRNPWDWHVSWFHYLRQDEGGRRSGHPVEAALFSRFAFSDYIAWLSDPDAPASPQGYIRRQMSDWLVDERGDIAVDRVLRAETIGAGLAALRQELNLDIRLPATRINASRRARYRDYFSAREADVIAERHRDDIARFGYVF